MSLNEALVILRDVREFNVGSAEFIVLEVARGASVKELHEHHPERVPSPLVVNRWRRDVPAFDAVMREAEVAKAEGLADEVIRIADDDERQAAQARNAMEARKWLASKLSEQFDSRNNWQGTGGGSGVRVELGVRLTDEQLMQIAAGKFNGGQRDVDEAVLLEGDVVGDALDADTEAETVGATDVGTDG
jgi:hypothetical protein